MNADPYRGEWGGKHCRDSPIQTTRTCNCTPGQCAASGKYVDQLDEVLRYSAPKGRVGGFFAESIQVNLQTPSNSCNETNALKFSRRELEELFNIRRDF